ncbi:uncharacterized protein [Acropora muricata]|uniref:uncharacterized protein n=1 Tax=Acropora muricata TaxID=159855 RepID=UPI0034E54F8B
MRKQFNMASISRCRFSLSSLQKSTSSLTKKSRNSFAERIKCAVGQTYSNSRIQTICGSSLQQTSKTSLVQTISKNYSVQVSRSFQQKFPPILACNPLLQAVTENLISSSEVEESSEDEATSGRKRIRSRRILDDDP